MTLGLSPMSPEVCACTFVHEKVKNGGMLMVTICIFIWPILKKSVIIVLPLKEKAIFNGIADGQNTDPGTVTSGTNSLFV